VNLEIPLKNISRIVTLVTVTVVTKKISDLEPSMKLDNCVNEVVQLGELCDQVR
jgi:hypothetical protein